MAMLFCESYVPDVTHPGLFKAFPAAPKFCLRLCRRCGALPLWVTEISIQTRRWSHVRSPHPIGVLISLASS